MHLDLSGTARPLLEGNTGENLCGLRFGKDFLNRNKKSTKYTRKKPMNWTSTYKPLVWPKMLLKNEKASHGPAENIRKTHIQLIAGIHRALTT